MCLSHWTSFMSSKLTKNFQSSIKKYFAGSDFVYACVTFSAQTSYNGKREREKNMFSFFVILFSDTEKDF